MKTLEKEIEFVQLVKSMHDIGLYYSHLTERFYFVQIKDNQEINRYPISSLNLTSRIEMDLETLQPFVIISHKQMDLFRHIMIGYDGCILTQNGKYSIEEGIQNFQNNGSLIISSETKILIVTK